MSGNSIRCSKCLGWHSPTDVRKAERRGPSYAVSFNLMLCDKCWQEFSKAVTQFVRRVDSLRGHG